MIKDRVWRQIPLALGICLLLGAADPARAACNNAKNWFEAPGPDIKVLIGYEQEQKPGFGDLGVGQASIDYPYPLPLPKEMLGKEGTGTLSETETSSISYYENDGKGGWRLCRLERWWPPSAGDDDAQRKMLRGATERYAARNPVLKKLGTRHMALYATLYFYDSKGRIERLEQGEFLKPDKKADIKICRQYDEQDNLLLLLSPQTSQSCTASPLDVRDEWWRYRYGRHDGKAVELLDEWHRGKADGGWSKDIGRFRSGPGPEAVYGSAKARSSKGLTVIDGSNAGKLDNNAANTVLDSFGRVNAVAYFFTKPPVSLDLLENPELIYKHERRRGTYIDGRLLMLYELFKPNEHRSRHRYYLEGGYVVRNEQLGADGRVVRVITVGDWRQPRPGPKPDVDDKLLSDKGMRLTGHQIYHRVYDLDAQGKPSLVAVSWNRSLSLRKRTPKDFADVVYGTPDGKERWKTKEAFEKHFDFSSKAEQVFPDLANGGELEDR